MTKRESKPVEFEGEIYANIRELADAKFGGRYNTAFQSVYRYQQRRSKRPVIWKGIQYESLAEMARLAFDPPISRERARQLVNKAAEDEQVK